MIRVAASVHFHAGDLSADLAPGETARIRIDDGDSYLTLFPTDRAALAELAELAGMLLEQLRT